MNRIATYIVATILAIAGVAVGLYTTDREFINLQPTTGAEFVLPLDATTNYQFTVTVTRRSLTRIGFWIKPLRENLPPESVRIILYRGDKILAEKTVATPFIDAYGFTQIRFSPPLSIIPGEKLTTQIIVPEALSGALGLAMRQHDESFSKDDAQLFVNNQRAPASLAHQAYFRYRPGLAIQIGALLFLGAGVLIFPSVRRLSPFVIGAIISGIALLPAMALGTFPGLVWIAQAMAWAGMYHLLAHYKLSLAARLVGAHCAGLTTYWALHYLGGTHSLLLFSSLPLAMYIIMRFPRYRWLTVGSMVVVACVAFVSLPSDVQPLGTAAWRDVLLDTYQVATAEKTANALPWHHFGSYVGVLTFALAFLGMPVALWRRWSTGMLLLGALAIYYSGSLFAWPAAYTVIIITYLIAYFAAHGLEALQLYLGNSTMVRSIIVAISFVILLDLLFVVTTTLETPYL